MPDWWKSPWLATAAWMGAVLATAWFTRATLISPETCPAGEVRVHWVEPVTAAAVPADPAPPVAPDPAAES